MEEFLKGIRENRGLRFINTGAENYQELGFQILSVINACQSHLINYNNIEEAKEIMTDVCNLLELIKGLLPHVEFELLDQLGNTTGN